MTADNENLLGEVERWKREASLAHVERAQEERAHDQTKARAAERADRLAERVHAAEAMAERLTKALQEVREKNLLILEKAKTQSTKSAAIITLDIVTPALEAEGVAL